VVQLDRVVLSLLLAPDGAVGYLRLTEFGRLEVASSSSVQKQHCLRLTPVAWKSIARVVEILVAWELLGFALAVEAIGVQHLI
jgi:hypothetical protein